MAFSLLIDDLVPKGFVVFLGAVLAVPFIFVALLSLLLMAVTSPFVFIFFAELLDMET